MQSISFKRKWWEWFCLHFPRDITGDMGKSVFVLLTGYTYHLFFNGSTFGLMYAVLAGRAKWGWGVAWGLFFELGMMTMPPVAIMTGPFGIFGFWPRLLIASLLAHIAVPLRLKHARIHRGDREGNQQINDQ